MTKLSKTKIFVILFATSLLLFSLWNIRKGDFYVSKTQILIIGRGENEKRNIEQIVENIQYFPFGIENLEISRVERSGLLELVAIDQDRGTALANLNENIRGVFLTISKYYNIKTDVFVSLVGEKSVENDLLGKISEGMFWKIIVSLILAGVISRIIVMAGKEHSLREEDVIRAKNDFSEKISPEKEELRAMGDSRDIFQEIPTIMDIKNEIASKRLTEDIEAELPLNRPEDKINEVSDGKKSAAPSNLPVAGDDIERLFGASKNGRGYKFPEISEAKKEESKSEEKPAVYREATPEEVKERLNKLLGSI